MNDSDLQFYVRRRGRVEGPWPASKLKSEAKLKKLSRFHDVSTDNKETWVRASELDWLFQSPTMHKNNVEPVQASETKADSVANEKTGEVQWYLSVSGEELGPYSTDQVADELLTGRAHVDDPAWNKSLDDWVRLGSIPEFDGIIALLDSEDTAATRLVQQPTVVQSASAPQAYSKQAIASLICGLLFCFPLNLAAIILSYLALKDISKRPDRVKGNSIAWAGGVIGAIAFVANVILIVVSAVVGAFGFSNMQ